MLAGAAGRTAPIPAGVDEFIDAQGVSECDAFREASFGEEPSSAAAADEEGQPSTARSYAAWMGFT